MLRLAHSPVTALARAMVVAIFAVVAGWARADSSAFSSADMEFFEAKVRPLFAAHCAECHSAKAGDPEGGLSFDSRADFQAAEGVAVAGKPDESLLVKVVRYDGDEQMPPDGKLPDEAIKTIEEWVRRGMPWPDDGKKTALDTFDIAARKAEHWCWHPPQASPVPAVKNAAWCRGDLDRFVLARLEAAGLAPAEEAPRAVLVRRASEILTGLPAEPADIDRLTTSADPVVFDKYVDQLLASPHYGERFARHWLDVVRYAETRGYEMDFLIPNAWQYRDWVIRALNADLPYDQFVREQIAGDLMDPPRLNPATGANESLIGTGFWLLNEEVHAPVDTKQDEAERIDSRIDTFGKAFLGLPLGCARCHDHKFDAISNEDYYALAGVAMSSSYRQVPFEVLGANRRVADRLAQADLEVRAAILPLLADAVGSEGRSLVETIEQPGGQERPAGPASGETVIADYTRAADSTPLITDATAWQVVAAGQPRWLPIVEGRPREIRLEPLGHARSDAIWSATRSTGDREPGPLGTLDRAGRVLRTPKVRLTNGQFWHRVRGHVQIFAVVDSHTMIRPSGPLYKPHIMTVDTGGEWKWIHQDLERPGEVKWAEGHLVHVEYAAVAGEAAVAEVVATSSTHPPERRDSEPVSRFNSMLAAPSFDWAGPAARRAVAEAERLDEARVAVAGEATLVYDTAPAVLDGNGIDQHVLLKGSAARPGELSPRRFLEAIDGPQQPAWPRNSSGRMQLADRVLDPANPLTSRVIVNRVWHHLFGRGLVSTPDNFGKLGEAAADPLAQALLDTLAVRFREEGWSLKRLVKEIVTSSTWRMSSARDVRAAEIDPLNLLLHHYPLRRLEGEAIRDKILAVSGRLDRTVGGASVAVHLTDFADNTERPESGPLDGDGRRSIYTKIRRSFLPGFLVAFDLPVPFQAMGRRTVTNVPAQALTLMNDPFVAEQARLWARKTLAEAALSPAQRIDRMYREAFARQPDDAERVASLAFLAEQAARQGIDFASNPDSEAVWADFAHALIISKEFIFVP